MFSLTLKSNWLTQGQGKDSERLPGALLPWTRLVGSGGKGNMFMLLGVNTQLLIAPVELGSFCYTHQCLKKVPDGQNHHTFSCILIYWPVRINLDRTGEIFSLPKILSVASSFLASTSSFSVSKHRREAQQNARLEMPLAREEICHHSALFCRT